MKKLTTEQQGTIKKALSKKWKISEGFIDRIFARGLAKNIKGDPEFKKLATDLDDAFTRLKKKAEERQRQGKPVPESWKHFLDS